MRVVAINARVSTGEQSPETQSARAAGICRTSRLHRASRVCGTGQRRRASAPARTQASNPVGGCVRITQESLPWSEMGLALPASGITDEEAIAAITARRQ
jgi:hypothetical protein